MVLYSIWRCYGTKNKDLEEQWGERDSLPEGDPIGDVEEAPANKSKSTIHEILGIFQEAIEEDQRRYFETMKGRLIVPEGKNLDIDPNTGEINLDINIRCPQGIDFMPVKIEIPQKPKCDCGIAKAYKNPTLRMHSTWCKLRENEKNG